MRTCPYHPDVEWDHETEFRVPGARLIGMCWRCWCAARRPTQTDVGLLGPPPYWVPARGYRFADREHNATISYGDCDPWLLVCERHPHNIFGRDEACYLCLAEDAEDSP